MSTTRSFRPALVRLASTLPKGSVERRALLQGLIYKQGLSKTAELSFSIAGELGGWIGEDLHDLHLDPMRTSKLLKKLAWAFAQDADLMRQFVSLVRKSSRELEPEESNDPPSNRAALLQTKLASQVPRPFEKNDWYGWAGAENLADGSPPWIMEIDDLAFLFGDPQGPTATSCVLIADSSGVSLNFFTEDPDFEAPTYDKQQRGFEPEEAEAALKAAARYLKSGRFPSGFHRIV